MLIATSILVFLFENGTGKQARLSSRRLVLYLYFPLLVVAPLPRLHRVLHLQLRLCPVAPLSSCLAILPIYRL